MSSWDEVRNWPYRAGLPGPPTTPAKRIQIELVRGWPNWYEHRDMTEKDIELLSRTMVGDFDWMYDSNGHATSEWQHIWYRWGYFLSGC